MAVGQPIGAIEAILSRSQLSGMKPPRISLAQKVAELIAIALHNATLYADVEHLCLIDDLTRLYNIRFLRQSLETEIRRAKRYRSTVALIFLDLDGFKNVNDLHGHLIGSATLVETARIIYSMVRDTDFVARYGGDEFVIILPETTAERAAQIAERIRQGIESYGFGSEGPRQFKLTASFGVAAYPEHGMTSQELIRRADAAMYQAKDASKNAVALAY
jgi:diguanylate cyclase (GGDEF)-like protein